MKNLIALQNVSDDCKPEANVKFLSKLLSILLQQTTRIYLKYDSFFVRGEFDFFIQIILFNVIIISWDYIYYMYERE